MKNGEGFTRYSSSPGSGFPFLGKPPDKRVELRDFYSTSFFDTAQISTSALIKEQYVPPRMLLEAGHQYLQLRRTGSSNSNLLRRQISENIDFNNQIYNLEELFKREKAGVLMRGNTVDCVLWSQYVTYKHARGELFQEFDYIFKADFTYLTIQDWEAINLFSGEGDVLTAFLFSAISNGPFKKSDVQVILQNPANKVLIIAKGYEKIAHLIDNPKYKYIRKVLDEIYKRSWFIITSEISLFEQERRFDVVLENAGYFLRDILRSLKRNLADHPNYLHLRNFIYSNYIIQQLCKSPSFLYMLSYVFLNSKEVKLKSELDHVSITSVYYDIVSLMRAEYISLSPTPRHGASEDSAQAVMFFMQELAYKTLFTPNLFLNNEIILELSEKHQESLSGGKSFIELAKLFKLIKIHRASTLIETSYVYIDPSFHYFMAAFYAKRILIGEDNDEKKEVVSFLIKHSNDKDLLQTMKFVYGLLSIDDHNHSIDRYKDLFFDLVLSSDDNVLKIGGRDRIEFLMHILSEERPTTGALKLSASDRLMEYIDDIIIQNIEEWIDSLEKTQYFSKKILDNLMLMLDNPEKKIRLIALKVASIIHVRTNEQVERIVSKIKEKAEDEDQEIMNASLKVLGYFISRTDVLELFLNILKGINTRKEKVNYSTNTLLIAIEVVSDVSGKKSVEFLLPRLEHSDSWVVLSVIQSLEKFNFVQDVHPIIVAELMRKLAYRGSNRELIISKTMKMLAYFGFNHIKILDDFRTRINSFSQEGEEQSIIEGLRNLNIVLNSSVFMDEIAKAILLRIERTKGGVFRLGKDYIVRSKLISFLSEIYERLSASTKIAVENLLNNQISNSSSELVKYSSVLALDNIGKLTIKQLMDNLTSFKENEIKMQIIYLLSKKLGQVSDEYFLINFEKNILVIKYILSNSQDSDIILKTISSIGYFLDKASLINNDLIKKELLDVLETAFAKFNSDFKKQEAIIDVFFQKWLTLTSTEKDSITHKIINPNVMLNSEMRIKIIQFFGSLSELQITPYIHDAIIRYFEDEDANVRHSALNAFILLYGQDLEQISVSMHSRLEIMRGSNVQIIVMQAAIESATVLAIHSKGEELLINEIISLLRRGVQNEIKKFLIVSANRLIDNISEPSLECLATILEIDGALVDKKRAIRLLEIMNLEADLLRVSNVIDILASRYADINVLSEQDRIQINHLRNSIFLMILKFHSSASIMRLVNLFLISEGNDLPIIDMVYYVVSNSKIVEERRAIIALVKKLFADNMHVLGEFDSINLRDNWQERFTTIGEVLDNLEEFAQYIKRYSIDVQITPENLVFGDKILLLGDGYGEKMQNAKLVYKVLQDDDSLLDTKVVKVTQEDLFHDYRDSRNANFLLTIVYKTTKDNDFITSFLIMESPTIFGSWLIEKIENSPDNQVQLTEYVSDNRNYRKLIFGNQSDNIKYFVKIFHVTNQDRIRVLEAMKSGKYNDIIRLVSDALPEYSELASYVWRDGISITQNDLIKYRDLEERVSELEENFDTLSHEVRALGMRQKEIDEIKKYLTSKDSIEYPSKLESPYLKKVYITIVHEFIELWTAAMVVQTSMVENVQTGVVGKIGDIFKAIGSHIPIVGGSVTIFGYVLSAVDHSMQKAISKNIANLAIDSIAASQLAKRIALLIIEKEVALDLKKISSHLGAAYQFQKISKKVKEIIDGYFGKQQNELEKAKQDSKLIMSLLTIMLADDRSFELDISTDASFEKLEDFLIGFMISPPSPPKIMRVRSESVDKSSESSGSPRTHVKGLEVQAKHIADEVVEAISILRNEEVEDLSSFKDKLVEYLMNEKIKFDQTLIYLSTLDISLKKDIINFLSYQIVNCMDVYDMELVSFFDQEKALSDKAFLAARSLLGENEYYVGGIRINIENNYDVLAISEDGIILQLPPVIEIAYVQIGLSAAISNLVNYIPFIDQGGDIYHNQGVLKLESPPNLRLNKDIAFIGGTLMTAMNSVPALNYLLKHYIPVVPLIENWEITKIVGSYIHPISTTLHFTGGVALTYAASGSYFYPITSSSIYFSKPFLYAYRDKLMDNLGFEENSWGKFFGHLASETMLTTAMLLPFVTLTPYTLGYLAIQGVSAGIVSYYINVPKESNYVTNSVSFVTTTGFGYSCQFLVKMQPNLPMKIIAGSSCINGMANVHSITRMIFSSFQEDLNLLGKTVDLEDN